MLQHLLFFEYNLCHGSHLGHNLECNILHNISIMIFETFNLCIGIEYNFHENRDKCHHRIDDFEVGYRK